MLRINNIIEVDLSWLLIEPIFVFYYAVVVGDAGLLLVDHF